MSLLIFPKSVDTLSALEIDADKNWQTFGIVNLKELVSGMQRGDILAHDGTRIVKLAPGNIGDEFTSNGPGQPVSWKAPPVMED
ncbi:hypothetical protein B1778_00765 [Dehalococcoides mccartyi]|nr:hypothetical protein B1777_00910 [Dehalococcoides mccartyi]AQU06757.1 hypothetical protein B1778_00765 [Dehalococcoides mccartyi]